MGKIPLDRFLALVERSGLVDRDHLAEVIQQWRSEAPPGRWDDAHTCGEHLVEAGLLTAWQCQKLLEGRHRGFRLGSYKLLDHLGSGGMSNVYLAEHVLMQRRVAIKVLPQNRVADSSQLARFHFEGQAVAALDHQNIVRAYDLGSEGRIHYLVMEYVEGSDLENLVELAGPPACHTAASYIAQAAAGLEHAHACGLVHRDIKPANLLVDRHDTVKILDMGLAKFSAEVRPIPAFARDEEVLGTAEYLAPEQAVNSLSVDHRADIYSLGCTLYFLLVGRAPFAGRTTGELVAAHQKQSPPNVLDSRPDVPAELAAICHKMMQKAPAERYQSAREVRDVLNAWLTSERAAGRISSDVASPSAVRDPDPQSQQTVRMLKAGEPSTPPRSDVFVPAAESVLAPSVGGLGAIGGPPPPPTPPVVPPPRDTQGASIPTVAPQAARVGEARSVAAAQHVSGVPLAVRSDATRPSVRAAARPQWVVIVALSALLLGAVLLALFALSK
jgi:serine/threonine-protein kinase